MVESKKVDLFCVEGVTKIYGNRFIFNNISFSIKTGEIIGIIGKSGSGKTTLLNMLIGAVKPEKGQIRFRDMHFLNNTSDTALYPVLKQNNQFKHQYSFATQTPSFYPNLTAIENLLYFGSLYGIPKRNLKINAENLLELVDLQSSKHLAAKDMSGGMQRRLDIACSLMHDPGVLILDEPTSDLDFILTNKIWDILRTINERGTTVIVVSHDIAGLESLCDRLIILKNGKIAAQGSPTELKNKHLVEESIYLHSMPGNYEKIMEDLKSAVKKNVVSYQIENNTLIIDATEAGKVVSKLTRVLDKNKERIIEFELRKTNLNKIFLKVQKQGQKAKHHKSAIKNDYSKKKKRSLFKRIFKRKALKEISQDKEIKESVSKENPKNKKADKKNKISKKTNNQKSVKKNTSIKKKENKQKKSEKKKFETAKKKEVKDIKKIPAKKNENSKNTSEKDEKKETDDPVKKEEKNIPKKENSDSQKSEEKVAEEEEEEQKKEEKKAEDKEMKISIKKNYGNEALKDAEEIIGFNRHQNWEDQK